MSSPDMLVIKKDQAAKNHFSFVKNTKQNNDVNVEIAQHTKYACNYLIAIMVII